MAQTTSEETLYQGLPDGAGHLVEGRDGTIYAAVFDAATGTVVGGGGGSWQTLHQGPVQGLQVAPDGDIWVAAGDDILCYRGGSGVPVARTAAFAPYEQPGALLATRWGDVWCAGCAARRRGDALFEAVPPAPAEWTVTPCCDDSFGNTWAVAEGTGRRDLAVVNSQYPHAWRLAGLPAAYGDRSWAGVVVGDSGFVWVGMQRAILRVDPRAAAGHRVFENPAVADVTAVGRVAGGQLVVGYADGSVHQLTVPAGQEPQWQVVAPAGGDPVRALLHDRAGGLWVLSGGRLRRLDVLRASWHANWEEQPRMPVGNHDHIFAQIDTRLYTAGGKTFYGWPADTWVNLDHLWSYDTRDGTWRVEPPMLEPGKAYSGIAALAGELWLLGGYFRDDQARNGTASTATVEIYDPQSRRLRLGPPLPRASGQIVALTVGERLYAIGGDGDDGPAAEVLSIAAGEADWSRRAPVPGPVSQASGCVLDGKIYIAAGPAAQCPGLFVYDPEVDCWSQVEHPSGRGPSAPLCAAFAGEVWVMGGRGAQGRQTSTFIYAPSSGQWRQGPDIPLPASWAAAAEVNGRLLIVGGAYEDDCVGDFYNTDRVFLLRPGC